MNQLIVSLQLSGEGVLAVQLDALAPVHGGVPVMQAAPEEALIGDYNYLHESPACVCVRA